MEGRNKGKDGNYIIAKVHTWGADNYTIHCISLFVMSFHTG